MSNDPAPKPRKPAPQKRGDRLKSALKANLARRKAQARARATETDTETDDATADNDNKD
ncbi:MAG: hypothetical protein U5K36_12090 [Roseovarius sp.]|nr:hypothetical protein [Roseovarius sp.]